MAPETYDAVTAAALGSIYVTLLYRFIGTCSTRFSSTSVMENPTQKAA